jgi:ribosomal protein S20
MRQVCLAVHHAHQKGVIHRNARVAVRSRVFLDIG